MRIKLILAALTAALLMAVAINSASARNISISHGELFTAEWEQIRLTSGGITVTECNVTLEGSFHYRTILKVRESLVGYITRAIANTCRTGSATALTERLPWHITYKGFQGTLPAITGIRLALIGAEFKIHDPATNTECLGRSETLRPTEGVVNLAAGSERRLVTSLTSDITRLVRCGVFEGGFGGTGRVREVPGRSENLLVRLI